MKQNSLLVSISLFLLTFLSISVCAQTNSVGVFEGNSDVGTNVKPGSAVYIPQTQQYVISGAGYNVWADHDEFRRRSTKVYGKTLAVSMMMRRPRRAKCREGSRGRRPRAGGTCDGSLMAIRGQSSAYDRYPAPLVHCR